MTYQQPGSGYGQGGYGQGGHDQGGYGGRQEGYGRQGGHDRPAGYGPGGYGPSSGPGSQGGYGQPGGAGSQSGYGQPGGSGSQSGYGPPDTYGRPAPTAAQPAQQTGGGPYGPGAGRPAGSGGGLPAQTALIATGAVAGLGVLTLLLGFLDFADTTTVGDAPSFYSLFGPSVIVLLLGLAGVLAATSFVPKAETSRALIAALSLTGLLGALFTMFSLPDGVDTGIGLILVIVLGFLQVAAAVLLLLVDAEIVKTGVAAGSASAPAAGDDPAGPPAYPAAGYGQAAPPAQADPARQPAGQNPPGSQTSSPYGGYGEQSYGQGSGYGAGYQQPSAGESARPEPSAPERQDRPWAQPSTSGPRPSVSGPQPSASGPRSATAWPDASTGGATPSNPYGAAPAAQQASYGGGATPSGATSSDPRLSAPRPAAEPAPNEDATTVHRAASAMSQEIGSEPARSEEDGATTAFRTQPQPVVRPQGANPPSQAATSQQQRPTPASEPSGRSDDGRPQADSRDGS